MDVLQHGEMTESASLGPGSYFLSPGMSNSMKYEVIYLFPLYLSLKIL